MNSPQTLHPPAGFGPLKLLSPALETFGPVYMSGEGEQRRFGMYVLEKHTNVRGNVHGGFLATLADLALGYTLGHLTEPANGFVTVSLNLDYAGNAVLGDWLETRSELIRRGRTLAFMSCDILNAGTRIVRANGVFMATGKTYASD